MNALAPLANLAELLAALQPADAPAAAPPAAAADDVATAFEAILLEARELAGAPPEPRLPAEPPPPEATGEPAVEVQPIAVPVLAAPLPEPPVPAEAPAEPPAPVEPRAPAPPPPSDAVPLTLAPSLVNLVLGTAEGTREAPRAEPVTESPEQERRPEAERTAPTSFEPAEDTAGPSLDPLDAGRERETRSTPRRESTPDSPAARSPEAQSQPAPPAETGPAADPLAHRSTHADAALRAAQAGVGVANGTPAPAETSPARDASSPAHLPRALPELPARGEVEVVRSVQVLAEQGGGRVHIRLDPPELGGVSLRVVVSDGVVHVSLLADQAPVADLLQRHSAELRSALESHGLRLDQLDVGTGHPDENARDAQPRDPDEYVPAGSRAFARPGDLNGPAMRRYDVSTLGAVDLHV